MVSGEKSYPNITWSQFDVCNDNVTGAFEDMSRRLFISEYLGGEVIPHSDHNNPGVEVIPILEPPHSDGSKQRKISFQAKYFKESVSYAQIKKSMNQAIKHYKNELDLIYLFCNKTLTTTSSGYKTAEELLKKSGIELFPISNDAVLDLVHKHRDIADYFFLPRKRPEDTWQMPANVLVISEGKVCCSCPIKAKKQNIEPILLKKLIRDKIQICKGFILEMQLDKLKAELDEIFVYNLTGIDGYETLFFYRLIVDLHDGKEIDISTDGITEQYKSELSWLKEYYKNPVPVKTYTFSSHYIESQIFLLDKMFTSQLWDAVISLCEEIIDDAPSEIVDIFNKYYGLALFNLQKYSMAADLFNKLYQKNPNKNMLLYLTFAEIKNISFEWQDGYHEHRDRLAELVGQLDSLRVNKLYKSNEKVATVLYLEAAYNLGLDEKKYLENAIERYYGFSEEVKQDSIVKYLYARCLELNRSTEIAETVYAELNWVEDANIAYRYLICKLSRNKYAEAIKLYEKIRQSVKTTELKGIYLTALYYEEGNKYEEVLKKFLEEVKDDFHGIIDIGFGIYKKSCLQEYIIPLIKKHIDIEVEKLTLVKKTKLLSILSHTEELELILTVIKNIQKISTLDRFTIGEIYNAVFKLSNTEYINHDKSLIKSSKLESSEQIADIFLEAEVSEKEFLQIKYLCAGAKEKHFSMLKYAKKYFEITHDESMARNIITLLFERDEIDFNEYTPYIDVLKNSTNPNYCMSVAAAMLRLGRCEEADLYAYKALYCLNDKEDYAIYRSYFGYYYQTINRYNDADKPKKVKGNSVITMEENSPIEGQKPKVIILCIDSESEFSDSNNTSMEVRHIPRNSHLYLRIQGSVLNQVLKVDGINYRIVDIQSRASYAARFVFEKISAHPEKLDGAFHVLKFEKTEELIEQIKSLTDITEQDKKLIDLYHFKGTEIGLPIDSLTNGDYSQYVDALKILLYTKDQALYTGFPVNRNEGNQKYVPTLSTLVLLSSMNILCVLDGIKNHILLPKSYKDFFAERYAQEKTKSSISPGKFVNVNNQLKLIENDPSCIEIWERIVDFCDEFKVIDISDEERIKFSFGGNINGEQFISAMQLHMIHLDAFILANKEDATLLCDDLFFRKIAAYGKIKNINSVSLLLHYMDKEFVGSIVMKLSKTNYLYIPLLAGTDEEAIELRKNILDGKLKKKYYSNMLLSYNMTYKKMMHKLFCEDIAFETT